MINVARVQKSNVDCCKGKWQLLLEEYSMPKKKLNFAFYNVWDMFRIRFFNIYLL